MDNIQIDIIQSNDCKTLIIPEAKKNLNIKPKFKKDRVITQSYKWTFEKQDLLFENQWKLINELQVINDSINILLSTHISFIKQQLKSKLYGYYYQDIKKKKYSEDLFIKLENIVKLLIDCNFDCYYCKNKVQVLYQHVREASQWTLERIDNEFGHNEGNVVIACLQCNLKRKTMYHERFVFTKQIKIIREPSV